MAYRIEEEELRQRLQWLINLRWVGILGIFAATHIVRDMAFLSFPLTPVYVILGSASLYNLYFTEALKRPVATFRPFAVAQIFLDQIVLAAAMYFSGGCDSPFVYFFIFHIVISGIILPWTYTLTFAILAVFFPAAVMGLKHFGILPHYGIFRDEPVVFTDIMIVGSYGLAFVSTIFLTAYFSTYLSKKLYEKNEEVRRLYSLSERLRSSIRLEEIIGIIQGELSGYAGSMKSIYLPLDRTKRVLTLKAADKELTIPLVDNNSFSEALLRGTAASINLRTVKSDYERQALEFMGSERSLLLPVLAAALTPCYQFFNCSETECGAYGREDGRCWQHAGLHCRGRLFKDRIEQLDSCLSCELFTPVGLYALNVPGSYVPLQTMDIHACMRLLSAAGLAVSNALLYERTLNLAQNDGLTGLRNHKAFKELFQNELLRAKRFARPFGLVMLDVDHFKHYNDTNGHPQGDILLAKLAELIRENLKDTDIVARYGGEEFVVLLPETSKEETGQVAERLRSMVEWCRFPKGEGQPFGRVTVSMGVGGYPEDGDNVESILSVSDAALYRAKKEGRNRVVVAGADSVCSK